MDGDHVRVEGAQVLQWLRDRGHGAGRGQNQGSEGLQRRVVKLGIGLLQVGEKKVGKGARK